MSREAFHAAGNSPMRWWTCGQNLILSASLLQRAWIISVPPTGEPDERSISEGRLANAAFGTTLMLRGFGVEALFKALYLDAGGVLVRNGRYVSPTRKAHDLRALAAKAQFPLRQREGPLLAYLEFWTEEGRYPVQADVAKYARAGGSADPWSAEWSGEHEGTWQIFIERLSDRGVESAKRWPGSERGAG